MYAGSGLVSIEEISRITNAPRAIIERLLDEEIVRPSEMRESTPLFSSEQVRIIERSLRLHEDLGVNWPGVAIIEDLLERMEALRQMIGRNSRTGEMMEGECE